MSRNRKEHMRYRYGMCLNDQCSKCSTKEVQQIATRKDFVCEECERPLRECPPPKLPWWKRHGGKLIIAVLAVLLVVLICWLSLPKGVGNGEPLPPPCDTCDTDTVKDSGAFESDPNGDSISTEEDTAVQIVGDGDNEPLTDTLRIDERVPDPSPKPTPNPAPKPDSGSKPTVHKLSGSSFVGRLVNGLPDGPGTLTFKRRQQIDTHDSKNRYAETGDYIQGTWENGHLLQGKWYGQDNKLKEYIMINKVYNPEADHTLYR